VKKKLVKKLLVDGWLGGQEPMKGVPMLKSISHFLLAVLFLLIPCFVFAEEPIPMTTDLPPLSSPPTLRPCSGQALGGKEGEHGAMEFEAGEIIVKFREGIPQASVQSLLLAEEVSILDEMENLGLMLLSVPRGQELEKIEGLKRNPLVEYAEPNYIVQVADAIVAETHCSLNAPDVIPNDPRYPGDGGQWNLRKIEAPAAWDITTGSDRVIIAFVDSGVDLEHPELKDKIWTNPGEIPGNGIDDDGNGYVDDVHGWDFVNWHGEPQDDYWHGTFVSSIAAAETNNDLGMAGVSWGAEIMPIKVIDNRGHSYYWHTAGGITYAADNGAKIINLSWTLTGSDYPQPLQAAVNYAYSKGALVVAAAGDSSTGTIEYPAALDHVVSVAATDRDDGYSDFSTHNDKVDIAAPGRKISGLCLKGVYCAFSSTHSAAPHVSGLAALIWSVNPTLTNDEVEEIIKSTAVDVQDPGWDEYSGYGRINARAAVMATTHYLQVEPDTLPPFLVCDGSNPPSEKITNPGTNSSTWSVTATAPWLSINPPEGYTPSSATVSIDKSGLPDYGLYTATITATSTMTSYVHNPQTIAVTVIYPSQCWRNYLPLLFKES
jgi:subtilisin family serine protease